MSWITYDEYDESYSWDARPWYDRPEPDGAEEQTYIRTSQQKKAGHHE